MLDHGHAASDLRNLELHRVALDKLRMSPHLQQRCLALVDQWMARAEHRPALSYLERWREMLAGWPLERISAVVLDPEGGQALRQCSPLGSALSPQERWAILRDVNSRMARSTQRASE